MRLSTLLSVLVLACTACGGADCTLIAVPGISVRFDGGLGPVSAVASEGSYRDAETAVPGNTNLLLAWGRPGKYRLEVRAPGHEIWVAEEVNVIAHECGVRTVEVTPEFVPLDQ